jgi:hypothetical protein
LRIRVKGTRRYTAARPASRSRRARAGAQGIIGLLLELNTNTRFMVSLDLLAYATPEGVKVSSPR